MEVLLWITNHTQNLLEDVGIVASLLFTAYMVREDARARKVSNLIAINQQHREIWKQLYEKQSLSRVLDRSANLDTNPISEEEQLFVNFLILHLATVYRAMEEGMFLAFEGLHKDIAEFFSLAIPQAVWHKAKEFQDKDFVAFVEALRHKQRAK